MLSHPESPAGWACCGAWGLGSGQPCLSPSWVPSGLTSGGCFSGWWLQHPLSADMAGNIFHSQPKRGKPHLYGWVMGVMEGGEPAKRRGWWCGPGKGEQSEKVQMPSGQLEEFARSETQITSTQIKRQHYQYPKAHLGPTLPITILQDSPKTNYPQRHPPSPVHFDKLHPLPHF